MSAPCEVCGRQACAACMDNSDAVDSAECWSLGYDREKARADAAEAALARVLDEANKEAWSKAITYRVAIANGWRNGIDADYAAAEEACNLAHLLWHRAATPDGEGRGKP